VISSSKGIDRQGLDDDFAVQEKEKSDLLLNAQVLRAQGQSEAAAAILAKAARLEERLSERCLAAGLRDKAWLHRFSAAGCWAQAGNFYQAINWCDDLIGQSGIPGGLRRRIEDFAQQLRSRRAQWYSELELANTAAER
jgi:hypothetical protein